MPLHTGKIMPIRSSYIFGLIIVITLLLASFYFQIYKGMMPCPLCILQRIAFGILGILFFIGIFVYPKHGFRLTINALCGLTSLLGIFLAGRQVWLQHFPSAHTTECGVSLQYMMQVLPLNEVIRKILT